MNAKALFRNPGEYIQNKQNTARNGPMPIKGAGRAPRSTGVPFVRQTGSLNRNPPPPSPAKEPAGHWNRKRPLSRTLESRAKSLFNEAGFIAGKGGRGRYVDGGKEHNVPSQDVSFPPKGTSQEDTDAIHGMLNGPMPAPNRPRRVRPPEQKFPDPWRTESLIERLSPAPAPVEAPPRPETEPGPRPAPSRPAPAQPRRHPNPYRRRQVPGTEPGPMPRRKAQDDRPIQGGARNIIQSLR